MHRMTNMNLLEEAQSCRRKALDYRGRLEEMFLLSAANAFEALSEDKAPIRQRSERADAITAPTT